MGWLNRLFGMRSDVERGAGAETSSDLAARLNRQRSKWLAAVDSEWQDAQSVLPDAPVSARAGFAEVLVSAFQAVHVSSFVNLKGYIDEARIPEFHSTTARRRLTDGCSRRRQGHDLVRAALSHSR